MNQLNPFLLLTLEENKENYLIPSSKNEPFGSYNPMQFVLRLRRDIHQELNIIEPGIYSQGSLTDKQIQAFSTYIHETIHWWQHIGSNFGFLSSLKFPTQSHLNHSLLKRVLNDNGAFKSIRKFDLINHHTHTDSNINRILNNWHDIENAGAISFNPNQIKKILKDPYFESVGHSYNMLWTSSIWTLASTFDQTFSFLPNIKLWEDNFRVLRENKSEGYYYGSPITVPPLGTYAIFEGQARFSQLQFLYGAFEGRFDFNDFGKAGMLNGIYVEAFNLFLKILNEQIPATPIDPLVSLFLLICDIAINPVDGFPYDLYDYNSFVISVDPGTRFYLLCIIIRDKFENLKKSIQNHSQEEYIKISKILCHSMACFSPYEGTAYICDWIKKQNSINDLLDQETNFQYNNINLPIRLFFSKFLRYQEDKFKYPHFFCWPGIHCISYKDNTIDLNTAKVLLDTHRALFINDIDGDVHPALFDKYDQRQVEQTFNEFYCWNSTYRTVRSWIIEDGPFIFNYDWLTSKYSKAEANEWVSRNFETVFGIHPNHFKIL